MQCIMTVKQNSTNCPTLFRSMRTASVIFFPIKAPGMGRFQLLNLGVLGYGIELRFWVVIALIVSLTLTITLITTLTII